MKNRIIIVISICISMLLVFVVPIAVRAASSVPLIQLNDHLVVLPKGEPEPYINRDGRTMVPIRFISTVLGVVDDEQHIKWDTKSKVVTISKDLTEIEIEVGKKTLKLNNMVIEMDTSAELKNSRVFIPLRLIAEALGVRIEWDAATNVIHILSDATNNFSRYGLAKITNGLPVNLKGDGYTLGLNEMQIYPYDSSEAKTLINKYGFNHLPHGTPYYIVWMKIDITNTGDKDIGADPITNQSPFSFGFAPADEENLQPAQPNPDFDQLNNPEILYKWHLITSEHLQSHIALILTQKQIERVYIKTDKENITLAIRQS